MEMRGFSHYAKDSYYRKAKEIVEYFGRPISQVTTKLYLWKTLPLKRKFTQYYQTKMMQIEKNEFTLFLEHIGKSCKNKKKMIKLLC